MEMMCLVKLEIIVQTERPFKKGRATCGVHQPHSTHILKIYYLLHYFPPFLAHCERGSKACKSKDSGLSSSISSTSLTSATSSCSERGSVKKEEVNK